MELFLALLVIAFIAVVTIDTVQQRRQHSFHTKDFGSLRISASHPISGGHPVGRD